MTPVERKEITPNSQAFLFDLSTLDKTKPAVVASASQIDEEEIGESSYVFVSSSAAGTRGATRVFLPAPPASIKVTTAEGDPMPFYKNWEERSGTLFLGYENDVVGVTIRIQF